MPPLAPCLTLSWIPPPDFPTSHLTLVLVRGSCAGWFRWRWGTRGGKLEALMSFFLALQLCHCFSTSCRDPQPHPIYSPSFPWSRAWLKSDSLHQTCQYSSPSLIFLPCGRRAYRHSKEDSEIVFKNPRVTLNLSTVLKSKEK